jgi:tetratricopeptide (TPR) repeat protein
LPAPIIKPNPNPYAKVEPKQIVPRDLIQLIKSKWVTRYHVALTMYMLHQHHEAEELLIALIHNIQNYNSKAILDIDALPDDFAKGQCIFYLGMASFKLGKYEEAINIYQEAIQSAWGRVVNNKMMALFAKGKAYQCVIRHSDAIETFSTCLGLDNKSPICSFVYFRRAWSYKKLGRLDESCADFEYAKRLNPNNPNFCVDYKAIVGFEFIQVNSDPDLVSVFPPLWDRVSI